MYGSSALSQALQLLATQARPGVLENEYNKVTARAIAAESTLSKALAGVTVKTAFPATGMGYTLRTVARLIGARQTLGLKRQVFLVQLLGFDQHSFLSTAQGPLLAQLADAMRAFHEATAEMGLAEKVTSFTASEMGRTLSLNGDGSDHGWGSHHFVVGGAVKGRAIYGTPPPISVGDSSGADDQWHVGQGRLLPTTSVDQFAGTLARWFGVQETELNLILPNLSHFDVSVGGIAYPRNLGFL